VETVLVGNEIYLLAGWSGGGNRNRKYNLSSRQWTLLPSSPNSQTWGTTAEYVNGNIYLVNSSGNTFAYNIADSSWTQKASVWTTGSADLSSILYQNEIYVIGFRDSTFFKYSPLTNQWMPLAKSPYQVGACAMGIINDKIYCVGGNSGGGSNAGYNSVIFYNITTNQWNTDSLRLSGKRHWMSRAEYRGGLYVLGGFDENSAAVVAVEQIVPQGTSSVSQPEKRPQSFALFQNYPNPFNPTTTIKYTLSKSSLVNLSVYDVLGRKVAALVDERQSAGEKTALFDGSQLSSGVYFYTIQADNARQTRKMILMK
jgi:hypothetical protein